MKGGFFPFSFLKLSLALQPDNCGPTYIIIGDGGNEEGVEDDFTQPQAAWSAYRDLAFGQASFVILNETTASWIWSADDGTPIDAVSGSRLSVMSVRFKAGRLELLLCGLSVHLAVQRRCIPETLPAWVVPGQILLPKCCGMS